MRSRRCTARTASSRRRRNFKARALIQDDEIYRRAEADYEGFWEEQAKKLEWFAPWHKVLEWDAPFAKWFIGGKINASVNCVDRHVAAGRGDRIAYYFEGEPGDRRTMTYAELLVEVCRCANALKELGVKRGDRVAIYMPMSLELPVAMLACARIGAPHTVVFGGFSAEALRDRILDADVHFVITSDGGYRRGRPFALKAQVDQALTETPDVRNVLVVRRTGQDVTMQEGRDVWWHDAVPRAGRRVRAGADGQRGHAVPALHLRLDRQAEGHPAHHRRLPARHLVHAQARLRPARRRHLLVRRRHRLGDRALLHRLRPARQLRDRA